MFNDWFEKHKRTDLGLNGSEKNGNVDCRLTDRNEQLKRLLGPVQITNDWNNRKPVTPSNPPTFEQIYQTATVKPPKLAYGIQKVAEMGNSAHLAGMSSGFKRKALLMALEAVGTDVGEVLSDVVARQRALKEFEDSYLERVNQFEAAQLAQNGLQQAELDRITSQFKARIQAGLDEVELRHEEFREWQSSKQQELHRFTEAAALCVTHESVQEEESDGKVMAIAQRATGTYR